MTRSAVSGQENIVDDAEGRCGWQNINLMQLALYRVSENVSFPVADITGAYPNSALREPRIIRSQYLDLGRSTQ